MKFLCDSCKAKYQIADEKVAGKTVRMKCRKCGHLIEIRAGQALAEPSALHGLPAEELSRIYEEPGLSEPPKAADKPAVSVAPRAPSPAAGAPAVRKPGAPAPRPSGVAGVGGGGGAPNPLRVAGGAAAAAAKAQPASAPAPAAAPRAAAAGGGGLASAFSKSVSAEPKPKTMEDSGVTRAIDMSSVAATEEWYVGISGVPVGPVRLTEMRAKAAQGQVTEDSLVWREGFEEWLPLRTFPDLVDLLRSAQSSERMPLNPGPAAQARQGLSNPFAAPSVQPPGRSQAPAAATPASIAPARGATVAPIRVSDRPEPMAAAAVPGDLSLGDPFAAPAAGAMPPVADAEPGRSNDVAAAPVFAAPVAAMPVDDVAVAPRQQAPARIPVAAWIAIVLALGTGVTAGSVLFQKPPPPPTVQFVTVTAPSPTAPVAPTATNDSVAVADVGTASPKDDPAAPRKVGGPLPGGATPKATATTAAPLPLGLPGVPDGPTPSPLGPSPSPQPGPAPAPPGGGEPLPASKLQEVVNANRNALKRACWEPALSAKGGSATSARVTISFTVGRDGRVSRSSASGGEAFPTLGTCIANRVKGWSFPSGFADTPTSATFSFVSQGG